MKKLRVFKVFFVLFGLILLNTGFNPAAASASLDELPQIETPVSVNPQTAATPEVSEMQAARSPGQISVRGRITYYDDKNQELPVRYAKIELWDEEPGRPSWDLGRTTYTDADGNYSFSSLENYDGFGQGGLDVFIKVYTDYYPDSNKGVVVTNEFGMVPYKANSPTRWNVSDGTVDLGTCNVGKRPEFILYDGGVTAYEFFKNSVHWDNPKVPVRFGLGDWAYFMGLPWVINLHWATMELYQIAIDDDYSIADMKQTMYHEYSHAVMFKMYGNRIPPSSVILRPGERHYMDQERDDGFAFTEGWAEFCEYLIAADTYLESNRMADNRDSGDYDGAIIEGVVAEVLWDIADPEWDPADPNDKDCNDLMPVQIDNLLTIIKHDHPDSIWNFKDSWTARGFPFQTELKYILYDSKVEQPPYHTLSFTRDGDGLGEVKLFDTVHSPPYSESFGAGSLVDIEAKAHESTIFTGWSGDYTGTGSKARVRITGETNITARFEKKIYTLELTQAGNGQVKVNDIVKLLPCSISVKHGDVVKLEAVPDIKWQFDGWAGDSDDTGPVTNVEVSGSCRVQAVFSPLKYLLTLDSNGIGNVIVNGDFKALPWAGGVVMDTEVSLEVVLQWGWVFDGWSGDAAGNQNPLSLIMSDNKTITMNMHALHPPPEVAGFTPDWSVNSGCIDATLEGTGLLLGEPGTRVTLVRDGQTDIEASGVKVVSDSTITCTFDLNGAIEGVRDVVVTNPDGQRGTLADDFLIFATSVTAVIGTEEGHRGYYPMNTWYKNQRTQVIYLADEIGMAGDITSLSLNILQRPPLLHNWTIRMKHTSKTDFWETGSNEWEASGWTIVYQAYESIDSPGWRTFDFSAPFEYDGVSNLMIDFSFSSTGRCDAGICQSTNAGTHRVNYASMDNEYTNPRDWTGTTPLPSVGGYIPNVRLELHPRLQLLGITPAWVHPADSIVIKNLEVTGFLPGATVKITRRDQADINATCVSFISPSRITCHFDLTGAETGDWNVTAANPDGKTATLAGGFHIRNYPPEVTGITPRWGLNSGSVDITSLSGSRFMPGVPGTIVKLMETGGAVIDATNINVVSSSQITCTFDLTEAKRGFWDVVVINPGGEAGALSGGFWVNKPGSDTFQIGSGTSSHYFPMGTLDHDQRTQVIYLADEISVAGAVTSLALDVTTVPGQTMNNWTIRMKHTPLSEYTTPAWEDSGWTVVYQGNELPGSPGWRTFNFTTSFNYNGVSNLMVDFSFNNDSGSYDGGCRYSVPDGNRTIYQSVNSVFGDPLDWSGAADPAPSLNTWVPNIRLTVKPPPEVMTGSATSITTESATLNGNLVSTGAAESIMVCFEYGTTASYGNTTIAEDIGDLGAFSADISKLLPGTTYHYRAVAVTPVHGTVGGADATFTTASIPPSVETSGASRIRTTSATLTGDLKSCGTSPSVDVFFEYGTTTEYGNTTPVQIIKGEPGVFAADITGLLPGTLYHFRARADGGEHGTVYSDYLTFITATIPPRVSVIQADNITAFSAVLHGSISSLGTADNVSVYFEWGATLPYTSSTPWQTKNTTGEFTAGLTELEPDTTYHFRARADGGAHGTARSGDVTFTTASAAPAVTTGNATGITAVSATLNGYLVSPGSAEEVEVLFEYGTSAAFGETTPLQVKTDAGNLTANISWLAPATTYYFRAKAVGGMFGAGAGDTLTFTTLKVPPAVTTSHAGNITTGSATLYGILDSPGSAATVDLLFEYGITTSYGNSVTGQRTSGNEFTAEISGLDPGKVYNFRAKADGGSHGSGTGANLTLHTVAIPPAVTSSEPLNITTESVTLRGKLESTGTASIVDVFFEYGTDISYGSKTTTQEKGAASNFTINVIGLKPGTVYHYRARADAGTCGAGTGSDMTFTTPTVPPAVNTSGTGSITTGSATLNGSLDSAGTAPVINVWFEYGITTYYGKISFVQQKTALGAFSAPVSGLIPGQTYHFRAIADAGVHGMAYGEDMTFIAGMTPPTVTSGAAIEITSNSALLPGNLVSPGTASEVRLWFEYGTDPGYGSMTSVQVKLLAGAFTARISGLVPGTTYHFRAIADGGAHGMAGSTDQSFTTLAAANTPVVATVTSADVSASSATLHGKLTSPGGASSVNVLFQYGITGSYGSTTGVQTITDAGDTFSATIGGLSPGVTYHFRAKADGGIYGTGTGLDMTFTTGSNPDFEVITGMASDVTQNSARLNGTVSSFMMIDQLEAWFEYGTTTSYGYSTPVQTMYGTGGFEAAISGLQPGTIYHFRARGIPSQGGPESTGADVVFMTDMMPPSLGTLSVTGITTDSATLRGNLTSRGSAASVNVYFEYGEATNYDMATPLQSRTATGAFAATVTGLLPGKTYHFRARADGGVHGTAASADLSFATAGEQVLTMAVNGNGITSPAAGTHSYQSGATVSVTAVPAPGWQFTGWTGEVTDHSSSATTVVMTEDRTVTADFAQMTFTLTLEVNGSGTTEPAAGVHTYLSGTVVKIAAAPSEGWQFTGWTGNATDPASPTTTVVMTEDREATAGFSQVEYTLTMAVFGSGNVTPAPGSHSYLSGTKVSITAAPAGGWVFAGWTGNVDDPGSVTTNITMNADRAVAARFIQVMRTLSLSIIGNGTVTPAAGIRSYPVGTEVGITAIPDSGWKFTGWSGNVGTIADISALVTTVNMEENYAVTANFRLDVIAGDANGDGEVDVLDITKAARIILQLDTETPGADANLDGVVNVLDMSRIAVIILGLIY